MNTKAFFLCWLKGGVGWGGGCVIRLSNLLLGTGKENQIFILRT